jgi:zeaxanthin glucosyltransferase
MHVAMISNGITSTVNASLEVARRLTAAGHSVTVLCHADIGLMVTANGHGFVRLIADTEAVTEVKQHLHTIRSGPIGRRLGSVAILPATMYRARRRTARGDELINVLGELAPDVVLIDIEAHLAVVASARWTMPTALTTYLFAIDSRPGVPPIDTWLGPDDQPALDAAWRTAFAANRAARRQRRWSRLGAIDLFGPISYSTASRAALRSVARQSGFDLRRSTRTRQWLRPHGYQHLPVLTTNLRELDFGAGAPDNWHYVGPMVDVRRSEASAGDDDMRSWIAARDQHRRQPDRPLIYCSLGSYWAADLRLLEQVVAVFASRPEWDLVIGMGGRGDVAQLGNLPPNVTALSWAPQAEVLAEADAAIVHGGNASLNECVWFGVPMLVCSTGHLDQNGVAARVAHHGVGRACDGRRATESDLARLLDEVVQGERIRATVDELSALARLPIRVDLVVNLVEQVAAGQLSTH